MSIIDEGKDPAQLEREENTRRMSEFAWEAMEAHRRLHNHRAGAIQVTTENRCYRFGILQL
jgi:hypothetical protein